MINNQLKSSFFVKQCVLTGLLVFVVATTSHAQNGVTAGEVVVGMSNALSGPAAALGSGLKLGAEVYFNKMNKAGGVAGRKIRLISYDDGYEPKNTVENTRKLIQDDKVFALFGFVGTPTSKAIIPMINQEKILYFGPFTGAEFLRNPVNSYVFNVRSSYFDEAEAQVGYLVDTLGVKDVGLFIQDDAYGIAVKGGVMRALRKRGLNLVGEGRYTRNTVDVAKGLQEVKAANPKAVSMVGTYRAMASFIREARATGFDPIFLNVSFVGTEALIQELDGKGDGTLVSQVVPAPHDDSLPIVKQYQADMKAAGDEIYNYVSLEGYIDAMVFAEILKRVGPDLTTESFIAVAESLTMEAGGMRFQFSPANHQALQEVYLTKIAGGKAVPVE
ncbi:MAG: ABC transporter substrate-binding protein [Proteobacteria bacterium]|nr:ABC transporter substrate-binding protein [Pseudomonadota bacterium]MBU1687300.1 ABC transporter substrate-binding protein [Pseudomonadota bacterium]